MPATVTKAVKATGGDYATLTIAEAVWDIDITAAGSDEQVNLELYDEAYDEIVTFDGATTDATHYVSIYPASGEEGDGTAGSGPRMRPSAGNLVAGDSLIHILDPFIRLDNFELGPATDTNSTGNSHVLKLGADNWRASRMLVHDINISKSNRGVVIENPGSLVRCLIYDIDSQSGGGGRGVLTIPGSGTTNVLNNTVHNVSQTGFPAEAASSGVVVNIKNNLCTDAAGNDFQYTVGSGTMNSDGNVSGDATADDNGDGTHVINVTTANQYVSTTGGSEDLHLKSGSDAIGVGVDLLTTPPGVEIDIDGYDVDAGGDTWDSSCDQFGKPSTAITGIASFNLPKLAVTGLGDGENRGIASFNLPVPTITGIGDIPISGIASFNLQVPTVTGIGDIPIVGIADFNLPVPTITGIAGGRIGSADFNLPVPTITGIGNIPINGVADFNLPILAITGIGDTLSRFGVADFNLPILAITAIGNIPIDGTANFNLPAITIPAIGDILIKGVADFDLPNLGLSSTGVVGALGSRTGMADFNLPSLWINTQGGVDIPMVNIFSTSGQTGAETGTAFTLQRKAGTWFINRDVLAQVILGSGSATIHIEVSLDGGSTFADIVSSGTASAIHAFNLPPIIRVRLSAATAATVNVWLDADLVVTRVNN